MPSPAVLATTTRKFLKGYWENYAEHNPVMSILMSKGNVNKNCEGTSLDWRVKAGRYDPLVVADYQNVEAAGLYSRKNHYLNVNIPWGEFAVGDSAGKGEFAQQGPKTAMVKLARERVPHMAEDLMDDGLGEKFFNQSNTGAGDYIGLEALFATYTPGTDQTNKVSGATLAAGGTYAGQGMDLGGVSVDGVANDAFTPTYVNSGATWDTSTGFTKANALTILSRGFNELCYGTKGSERPDCAILSKVAFQTVKDALRENERVLITGKADSTTGQGRNWEHIYVDGYDVLWDAHVTATDTSGYILNFNHIHLDQLQVPGPISADKNPGGRNGIDASMFDVEFDYSSTLRALLMSATSRGQYRFNPRYQGKIGDFTS
ncbi:MAG: hypothetical protein MJH10_13025 [Epibacterium sp.]|nr:hypothetical protein [Epibacterium sp.]NQX74465.1 hypothetical protein [Epibacterium sp.]